MEDYLKLRGGPIIGAVLDLPLADFISFQPSVQFAVKGTAHDMDERSDNHSTHDFEGYDRVRVMYTEVPLNFAGKLELGPGSIQVFAGPYVAMAISGKNIYDYEVTHMDGSVSKEKGDLDVKFKGEVDEDDLDVDGVAFYQRRLDFGVNFGVGYQWNALLFNAGYAMGFTNLQPDYKDAENFDPKDFKYSNRSVFFTVAWLFGGE